jgi:hypothetical protein
VKRALETIAEQEHPPELVLRLERIVNEVLVQLPTPVLGKLFHAQFEVAGLPRDLFASFVAMLDGIARGQAEFRGLDLRTLWSWYWERDVLAGRRFRRSQRRDQDIALQKPYFWRPGLAAKPFWTLEEIPWVKTLEESCGEILEELNAIRERQLFQPYRPVEEPDMLIRSKESANYSDWNG